jgi:O-antigen/teichoic acid export membrane protein
MDFGLSTAVVRFYSKYKALHDTEGMENILAISVRGYGIVAVLVLLVGGICYLFLGDIFSASMTAVEIVKTKHLFLLLLFNIAVTLSTMIFRSVINAHERFLFLKGMETVELVIQPIVVILVLREYPSAFSVALVQTVLNLVLTSVRAYYCFHTLHISIHFHYWNYELLNDFKKLALSVFAVSIIDQVFFKTNQVILGIVSGTTAVAVYSIASLIYMNYMSLSTAISGVYLPHVTGMIAKKASIQNLSDLFIQIGRWQYFLLALVTTGFIIFGKQFITIWAGVDFGDAYWITLLIIIPFTIDLIQNIGLSILQATNHYDFRARVYFGIGIFNLCLAIPLGIKYGGIGCAFATGLSMFLGNGLIMNWYYCTQMKLNIKSFWQQIGKISVAVCICLIGGYTMNTVFYSDKILVFFCKILGYVLFYCIVIYVMAMTRIEKEKIYRLWRRN